MQSRGFGIFHLENMGFSEQVSLFYNAKVIVAPHGAGLANLVFCNMQPTVLEFFSHKYYNPIYKHLCEIKGINHQSIFDNEVQDLLCDDCYADFEIKVSRIPDTF